MMRAALVITGATVALSALTTTVVRAPVPAALTGWNEKERVPMRGLVPVTRPVGEMTTTRLAGPAMYEVAAGLVVIW